MANGTLKVQNIETSSGSGTITLGQSGETVVFGSGVTTKFNQPAFEAYLSSDQTVSDNTATKVQADTEVFDTDNCYDNSTNYRFTPTISGKYWVYGKVACDTTANSGMSQMMALIYKNGSVYSHSIYNYATNFGREGTPYIGTVLELNGTTDYVELFGQNDVSSGTPTFNGSSSKFTIFGAYRLGVE